MNLPAFYSNGRVQWTLFAVLFTVELALMVRAYEAGKDPSAKASDRAFYLFLSDPSWKRFKCWFGLLAENPWLDIATTFLLGFLPLPGLPTSIGPRVETLLAKIGIYKIVLALVLPAPKCYGKDCNDK